MDADLQDDVRYLSQFIKTAIKKNPDLIIGYRVKRNHNKVLVLASKIYDLIVNIILGYSNPSDDELWAADMNNDDLVNIQDIVILVNNILR